MEKENDIKPEEKKDNNDNVDENKVINEQDLLISEDPDKIISDLTNKIILLEKANNDLKIKNESLIKNDIKNNSLNLKTSLLGMKWSLTSQILLKKAEKDSNKLEQIIKEKNDAQEINEKMLDLLTEKEIENEDLNEKLKNTELKSKIEMEQKEEKIKSLEEKIKSIENFKEEYTEQMDDIVKEYNSFQEKLKLQIKELNAREEELLEQNNLKENEIHKLSEEIRDLQLNNLQLKSKTEKMEKIQERDYAEQEELFSENVAIKKDNEYLKEKIKLMEKNIKNNNKLKEEEIISLEKKLQEEKDSLKKYKENKTEEISNIKTQMNKIEIDNKYLVTKNIQYEKNLEEEKAKNYKIQINLDKKTKELKELTDYSKKLLTNKDNIISEYEEKIIEMNKEKSDLIKQNKELIDKLKTKTDEFVRGESLEDIMIEEEKKENLEFYIKENKLLNEEINGLKEQLVAKGKQSNEVEILNDEIFKLKMKNEKILKENEDMKNQIQEYHKQKVKNKLMTMQSKIFQNMIKLKDENKALDKINYEKQIEALKKLLEEEKENYEGQNKKLKTDLVVLKMKNTKQQILINTTNEKIKSLNLRNFGEKEIQQNNNNQNYISYLILSFAFIILLVTDSIFS